MKFKKTMLAAAFAFAAARRRPCRPHRRRRAAAHRPGLGPGHSGEERHHDLAQDHRRREPQADHARRRHRPDRRRQGHAAPGDRRQGRRDRRLGRHAGGDPDGRRGGRSRARCSSPTSPAGLPPGKDKWFFRLPQSNDVMAYAVVEHMKKQGVKTIGFLGYTDAYGELWLKALTAEAEQERHQDRRRRALRARRHQRDRAGAQAHLGQPRRDPDRGLGQRRRHAAEGHDGARLQGQDLPDARRRHAGPDAHRRQGRRRRLRGLRPGHGRRAAARQPSVEEGGASPSSTQYEKAYGPGSRNQFAGHGADALTCSKRSCRSRSRRPSPARRSSAPRCATPSRPWAAPCSRTACSNWTPRRPLGLHQRDRRDAARS